MAHRACKQCCHVITGALELDKVVLLSALSVMPHCGQSKTLCVEQKIAIRNKTRAAQPGVHLLCISQPFLNARFNTTIQIGMQRYQAVYKILAPKTHTKVPLCVCGMPLWCACGRCNNHGVVAAHDTPSLSHTVPTNSTQNLHTLQNQPIVHPAHTTLSTDGG